MKSSKIIPLAAAAAAVLTGCAAAPKSTAADTAEKNVTLNGWALLGRIETVNPHTGTPQGELISGKFNYRSRHLAVPQTSKVPVTGYFRAASTRSLFGVQEQIIEYDFTAGDGKSAVNILDRISEQQKKIINLSLKSSD